jgi:hypothetical protein
MCDVVYGRETVRREERGVEDKRQMKMNRTEFSYLLSYTPSATPALPHSERTVQSAYVRGSLSEKTDFVTDLLNGLNHLINRNYCK